MPGHKKVSCKVLPETYDNYGDGHTRTALNYGTSSIYSKLVYGTTIPTSLLSNFRGLFSYQQHAFHVRNPSKSNADVAYVKGENNRSCSVISSSRSAIDYSLYFRLRQFQQRAEANRGIHTTPDGRAANTANSNLGTYTKAL